jgi:hypothetical protein
LLKANQNRQKQITMSLMPLRLNYYKKRIKQREQTKQTVKLSKQVLDNKLSDLQQIFEYLQTHGDFESVDDLITIIETIESKKEMTAKVNFT